MVRRNGIARSLIFPKTLETGQIRSVPDPYCFLRKMVAPILPRRGSSRRSRARVPRVRGIPDSDALADQKTGILRAASPPAHTTRDNRGIRDSSRARQNRRARMTWQGIEQKQDRHNQNPHYDTQGSIVGYCGLTLCVCELPGSGASVKRVSKWKFRFTPFRRT
jgi:hypothetical protein